LRRLHIWFLFCVAVLVAIPTVGLGVNATRILMGGALSAGDPPDSEATFPQRVDEFIQTHFGFRQDMVEMNGDLKTYFSGRSPRVVAGSDNWLFITDGDVFSQITGQRVDVEAVGRLTAMMKRLTDDATRKGRQAVFAVAPEKQTIYRHKLPRWARKPPARTEHDVMLAQMHAAGINAVDLRPVLLSRVADRPIYWRGDTHWTEYGAVLGFNEILSPLGLAEHRIDAESAFGPERRANRRGDLVGMMGIKGEWVETHLPPVDPALLSHAPFERTVLRTVGRHETFRLRHKPGAPWAPTGPKVLVIGDSFTQSYFGPLFMRFASEFVWTHRRLNSFEQDFIDEVDPDIIVFETVERTLNLFR
jgi:alginate O-acetyltransferase complex protein AlgJ